MFDIGGLKKQMEDGKDRWKKIDELVEHIKNRAGNEEDKKLAELIILLVEQIKPAYSPATIEKSMKEVLEIFTGGAK